MARELPGRRLPVLPIAFGPVRSRRLGWSLGINNVPPKTCTYSCVYCQVGATDRARLEREAYFEPDAVVTAVRERLAACQATGQPVDYATFVPDGDGHARAVQFHRQTFPRDSVRSGQ